MLRIHQPYIKKKKVKDFLALAGIGALLLGSGVVFNSSAKSSVVYAAGESRTLSDISTMQEMTQQICSNSEYLEAKALRDTRNHTFYTVIKLRDDNCWMQQNLRLGSTSDTNLTSNNTNITSDWTLPAAVSSWSADNSAIRTRIGSTSVVNLWQTSWGNYYSWCAATAGTCSESATSNMNVMNVSGSICPKGWHLPSGGTEGEFYALLNGLYASTVKGSPYFFSAAGEIAPPDGTIGGPEYYGKYWSRTTATSNDSSYGAFYLYFESSLLRPGTDYDGRWRGFSVRCVASGGLDKIEKSIWEEDKDGNVTVNVPSTLTIDAASGMEEVADAGKVIEGTATATISSNTEYTVTLHSSQPALRDIAEGSTNEAEISPVSDSNPVQPGNNSWGFWNGTGNASAKTYTLPISGQPAEFYNTIEDTTNAAGDPAKKHTYYVGISISPSLPSGIYATDVIITAATK